MQPANNAVPIAPIQLGWFVDVVGSEEHVETVGPMDYATATRFRDTMLPMRSVQEIHLRQAGAASRGVVEKAEKYRQGTDMPAECQ